MGAIIDQSGYIVFRHFRKLFLENAFETGQYDQAFSTIIVVDHSKLDVAIAFLLDSRLALSVRLR
jgi:hypothetical protein